MFVDLLIKERGDNWMRSKMILFSLLLILGLTPSVVYATTCAVVVDESGCYVSGSQAGKVDSDLMRTEPVIATATQSNSTNSWGSLLSNVGFVGVGCLRQIVVYSCSALAAIGLLALYTENEYRVRS